MKIVADYKIPFLKGVLEPFCEIVYLNPSLITPEAVKDADALIVRTRTKCNAALLEGSAVKLIATATIGYDHIDTDYCNANNIKWINAPGCNSTSVMQYFTSAMLMLAEKKNISLKGMTIGIVGVGNVGAKIANASKLLGMNVLLNDPPRSRKEGETGFVSLEEIISKADIITFHVPLNKDGIDKTVHLADEEFFAKLERKIILMNSSRGPVVKTGALKNAIKEGKIDAAILDVWENEPNLDLELMNLVDIATPHIAGYSADGKANGTAVCVDAVNEYFNLGLKRNWRPAEIPNAVNPMNFTINCTGLFLQEIIYKAVVPAYNIYEDDTALRKSPAEFEKQRNDYKVRREFEAYTINLSNPSPEISFILKGLGFNIK